MARIVRSERFGDSFALGGIGVRISDETNPVLALPVESERCLPIVVGLFEARSIATCLPEDRVVFKDPPPALWQDAARAPLIYDFLKDVLTAFGVEMTRAVVDLLEGTTYFALDRFERKGDTRWIDARPSDSLALALRYKCPLFATREVIERAGIPHTVEDVLREGILMLHPRQEVVRLRFAVNVGDQIRFKLSSEEGLFRWTSSDSTVGTIDTEGVFAALGVGKTEVRACD